MAEPDPLPQDVQDVFDEQDDLSPNNPTGADDPSGGGSGTGQPGTAGTIYGSPIGQQDPCFAVRLRRADTTGVVAGNLMFLKQLLRTFIPVAEDEERSYPIQGPIHVGGEPITGLGVAQDDYDAVQIAQLNTI